MAFIIFSDLSVSEHESCIQYDVAFLELPLPCPLNVATDRAAFLFGHSREDCQEYFASGCQRVNVLTLEVHADSEILELSDVLQRIDSIPSEAANALNQHFLYFPRATVLNHAEEVRSFFCSRPADAGIRIDINELPLWF